LGAGKRANRRKGGKAEGRKDGRRARCYPVLSLLSALSALSVRPLTPRGRVVVHPRAASRYRWWASECS
jgi:hypothetical protein